MGRDDGYPVHGPHLLERPLDRCPSCASVRLVAVTDGGAVHFLCDDCGRCWNVHLGYVARVNPQTCDHCEHFERCATTFALDHGIEPKR
jgi:transposase-like protein